MQSAAESVPVASVLPVPKKPTPKVHPSYFFNAASRRNVKSMVVAHGVDYAAVFSPAYWAHVAKQLRPGDLIEVTAEDGSYFAILYVVSAATNAAAVVELLRKDLQDVELEDATSGFEVSWAGPIRKWAVKRLVDGVWVADKLDTKSAAHEAMANHIKALVR